MPSVKHNLITDKAMGLIFHRFSPRGAFWHTAVRAMYSSGTYQYPPLCSISLLTVKSIDLVVARDGFPCEMKIIRIFHGGYLDYRGALQTVLDS